MSSPRQTSSGSGPGQSAVRQSTLLTRPTGAANGPVRAFRDDCGVRSRARSPDCRIPALNPGNFVAPFRLQDNCGVSIEIGRDAERLATSATQYFPVSDRSGWRALRGSAGTAYPPCPAPECKTPRATTAGRLPHSGVLVTWWKMGGYWELEVFFPNSRRRYT